MSKLIGIDIGGTNFRVGLIDGMRVISENRINADFSALCRQLPSNQACQKIVDTVAHAINKMIAEEDSIFAIGIGFPGFIDPQTGHVFQSPNLPGLINIDLAGMLTKSVDKPVVVENDALAAAYGEYRLQNLQADMIYVGLGTGVGGGLISQGRPFSGQHGFSMEIGHLIVEPNGRVCGCGNHGCLEQYASASGISKTFFEVSAQSLAANEVAELASQDYKLAQGAFDMAGEYLAQAVALTLNLVDSPHVVIGGGLSAAWSLMEKSFHSRLQADLIPVLKNKVSVSVSSSGDQAGMIGAALLAELRAGQ